MFLQASILSVQPWPSTTGREKDILQAWSEALALHRNEMALHAVEPALKVPDSQPDSVSYKQVWVLDISCSVSDADCPSCAGKYQLIDRTW